MIERKINLATEEFRKMWGWSWETLGAKMDEDPISLKRYIQQDRCELVKVAKQCVLMRLPFFSVAECATGGYIDELRKWMIEADLTTRMLIRSAWPHFNEKRIDQFKVRAHTAFSSGHMSEYMAASFRQALGRVCINPSWLLTNEQMAEIDGVRK